MLSAKTWAVFAVTSTPLIHLYQSPEDSSSDSHEARPEWASWEAFHMLGKLVHLRLSFPAVETTGALLVWHYVSVEEGQCGQSVRSPLTLLMWDFHSGVFSMDSCWWSSCERDWSWPMKETYVTILMILLSPMCLALSRLCIPEWIDRLYLIILPFWCLAPYWECSR